MQHIGNLCPVLTPNVVSAVAPTAFALAMSAAATPLSAGMPNSLAPTASSATQAVRGNSSHHDDRILLSDK